MNPYTIMQEMGIDTKSPVVMAPAEIAELINKACPKWIPVSESIKPPVNTVVFAFHPNWVNEYYSDDGIHECVLDTAGNWHLVRWDDKALQWNSRSSNANQNGRPYSKRSISAYFEPSHFMYKPMPPNYGDSE